MSETIVVVFVISALSILISGFISSWGQMSRREDVQQIAQVMAREISLAGEVNNNVQRRLEDLEHLLGVEVEMRVDGNYIGSSQRLQTESDFTVYITYNTKYGVGWINWRKEKPYVAKASGTAEEYHKG